jgi:hypothetical protein
MDLDLDSPFMFLDDMITYKLWNTNTINNTVYHKIEFTSWSSFRIKVSYSLIICLLDRP